MANKRRKWAIIYFVFVQVFRIFIMFCSAIAIMAIVIQYFVKDVSPGWSSMIATVCLMGGMSIMRTGVVGIYVGNIFMQSKEHPLYVIRTVLNDRD